MELSNLYFMTDSTDTARRQMTDEPSFRPPPVLPHYPTVLDGAFSISKLFSTLTILEGSRGREGSKKGSKGDFRP